MRIKFKQIKNLIKKIKKKITINRIKTKIDIKIKLNQIVSDKIKIIIIIIINSEQNIQ